MFFIPPKKSKRIPLKKKRDRSRIIVIFDINQVLVVGHFIRARSKTYEKLFYRYHSRRIFGVNFIWFFVFFFLSTVLVRA